MTPLLPPVSKFNIQHSRFIESLSKFNIQHSTFKILSLLVLVVVGASSAMTPQARKSFLEFERKAEAGDPEAMFRLSALLEKGFDSIPADTARSVSLLRRAAAADYPPALNYLGYLLRSGKILPADPDSALWYLRRAADLGDLKAAHNIAFLTLGPDASLPADSASAALALGYLRRAADGGLPQAETMLADLYARGQYLPLDSARAVALYEKAVARGFPDAQPRLLNLIGPGLNNLSSSEALAEAVRYWKLGAHAIAVEILSRIPSDAPEAARAYALLGHAASRGLGIPYNHRLANEYFARSAMLGNPSAAFILAETLEIFPDALESLFPDLPDSMSPQALRQLAHRAGIDSPEQAVSALLSK